MYFWSETPYFNSKFRVQSSKNRIWSIGFTLGTLNIERAKSRLAAWFTVCLGFSLDHVQFKLAKSPAKNEVDVGQVVLDAPDRLDLLRRKVTANFRVLQDLALEIAPLFADLERVTLHHSIGTVPSDPFVDQREQDAL